MSKTIYIIYGLDTEPREDLKRTDYLLGKYLEPYGVTIKRVLDALSPKFIQDKVVETILQNYSPDGPLNIILDMHGSIENGTYTLKANFQAGFNHDMLPEILLNALNGIKVPVNMLALCCFGAHMHKYVHLLPVGSKLVTLSSHDSITSNLDMFNSKNTNITNEIFKHGFSFDKLVELYLLSQKAITNTPIISWVLENEKTETINIADYCNQLIQNNKINYNIVNEGFKCLLKLTGITDDELKKAIEKVIESKDINSLKTPDNVFALIAEHVKNNTLEALITETEKKYYGDNRKLNNADFLKLVGIYYNAPKETTIELNNDDISEMDFKAWYKDNQKLPNNLTLGSISKEIIPTFTNGFKGDNQEAPFPLHTAILGLVYESFIDSL